MSETHVTLTGNLTDDPELKFTTAGVPVTSFRLACTPRVRDGEGWKDGDTSFFRVNVWRDQAENVADSLTKGNRAIVIGRLKARTWETPEGERRTVVEVEADEVAPSLRWATARPERATKREKATAGAGAGAGQFTEPPPF